MESRGCITFKLKVIGTKLRHSYLRSRVARIEHRTPLWMHEETVQPDHFGATADS